MKQISERIFYCGILNPNLRVFDVVMRTDFGTSYNAYVVKGSEATAIIDAAHYSFSGLFLEELREALGGRQPDYLVVNHTEPDHSGAIAAMLEVWPGLTVVTNGVAAKYLRQMLSRDFSPRIVKDGDTLPLGDCGLRFLIAPFLHWPDSMMTWLPEEGTLFSCDVFGCHYCEQGVTDANVTYERDYQAAFRYYYDCIFGPFRPFVQKGLQKLESLDLQRICPSHGPVLTRGCKLESALDAYQQWSAPVEKADTTPQVPVFYCSAYGNTARIGRAVREGILEARPGAACALHDLTGCNMPAMGALLNQSDAFALGCLTINRDAVPPLWALLSHADAVNMPKRPCALFGSYGWSGEAFANIAARLQMLKCNVFEEQFRVNFVPSGEELAQARAFGRRFAERLP